MERKIKPIHYMYTSRSLSYNLLSWVALFTFSHIDRRWPHVGHPVPPHRLPRRIRPPRPCQTLARPRSTPLSLCPLSPILPDTVIVVLLAPPQRLSTPSFTNASTSSDVLRSFVSDHQQELGGPAEGVLLRPLLPLSPTILVFSGETCSY